MPKPSALRIRPVLAAALLALAATAGCTMIEHQQANSTEQLLAAGGFSIKAADTPQKLAALQQMKQRKLLRRKGPDGNPQFLFADAQFCRCLYVGDEAAYQNYQRLSVQQQIADDNREAALDASMDSPWAYDWWSPAYPYPY